MKKPNTSFYVSIILIAIVLVYVVVAKMKMRKNGILLNAKTITWVTSAKVSLHLQYEFYYNGERVIGNNAFNDFKGNKKFENRYFPVIYYPRMGGHSQLLIVPSDFKKFNLPFPDSLRWVLPYLNN